MIPLGPLSLAGPFAEMVTQTGSAELPKGPLLPQEPQQVPTVLDLNPPAGRQACTDGGDRHTRDPHGVSQGSPVSSPPDWGQVEARGCACMCSTGHCLCEGWWGGRCGLCALPATLPESELAGLPSSHHSQWPPAKCPERFRLLPQAPPQP